MVDEMEQMQVFLEVASNCPLLIIITSSALKFGVSPLTQLLAGYRITSFFQQKKAKFPSQFL
jgi:hypothetical protein